MSGDCSELVSSVALLIYLKLKPCWLIVAIQAGEWLVTHLVAEDFDVADVEGRLDALAHLIDGGQHFVGGAGDDAAERLNLLSDAYCLLLLLLLLPLLTLFLGRLLLLLLLLLLLVLLWMLLLLLVVTTPGGGRRGREASPSATAAAAAAAGS